MATYKADHLKAMIREVVRQELRESVASVIAEVLSERFLRKIVETTAAAQPRGVSRLPIQGDDEIEEETPSILSNDILGVGQENPVFKKVPKDRRVREPEDEPIEEGTERTDFLSLFFEGTKPIKQVEEQVSEGVPLPLEHEAEEAAAEGRRPITEVWRALAGTDKKPAGPAVSPEDLEKREEARLKRLREELDRKP